MEKLSLEWIRIQDKDLQEDANYILRDNARFYFEQSIKNIASDLADDRIKLGDDFNQLYYYPLGKAVGQLITHLNDISSSAIDIPTFRFEYGDAFFDELREQLITRFGNVACSLAYLNMPNEDGAELLITTKQALEIAKFNFNPDTTIATPPPRQAME